MCLPITFILLAEKSRINSPFCLIGQCKNSLPNLWISQFFDDNAGDYSGDGAQHLCSKYDPYFQPANLLKVISDAIYVLDSMPCTCGCFIEEPCENPTVSRSDYNSFQSSTVLLGSYVLDNDVWNTEGEQNGLESWVIYYTGALRSDWRAGRSSSTVHNDAYRSKIAPGFLLTYNMAYRRTDRNGRLLL